MSNKRSFYVHLPHAFLGMLRARGQITPLRIALLGVLGLSPLFFTLAEPAAVWAQQLSVVSSDKIQGVVRDLAPGEMTIVDTEGVAHSVKIQNKGEAFIVLGKNRVRFPAKILSLIHI